MTTRKTHHCPTCDKIWYQDVHGNVAFSNNLGQLHDDIRTCPPCLRAQYKEFTMEDFTIQKDIPAPKGYAPRGSKYPFIEMDVGDSFFVPTKPGEDINRTQSRVGAAARKVGRENEWTFRTSRREENDTIGVRVWRVE